MPSALDPAARTNGLAGRSRLRLQPVSSWVRSLSKGAVSCLFCVASASCDLKMSSTGPTSGPRYSVLGRMGDLGIGLSFRSILSSRRLALMSRVRAASCRWSCWGIFPSKAMRVAMMRSMVPTSWGAKPGYSVSRASERQASSSSVWSFELRRMRHWASTILWTMPYSTRF